MTPNLTSNEETGAMDYNTLLTTLLLSVFAQSNTNWSMTDDSNTPTINTNKGRLTNENKIKC